MNTNTIKRYKSRTSKRPPHRTYVSMLSVSIHHGPIEQSVCSGQRSPVPMLKVRKTSESFLHWVCDGVFFVEAPVDGISLYQPDPRPEFQTLWR